MGHVLLSERACAIMSNVQWGRREQWGRRPCAFERKKHAQREQRVLVVMANPSESLLQPILAYKEHVLVEVSLHLVNST